MIDGVQIIPLKRIPDERGTIMHMMRADDPHFKQFGEIYFATVYRDVVKAWHWHREMTLNYACIFGRIKLVLYDDRPTSPTRGELMEIFLGPENYSLVIIPPEVWNGHKGLADPYSIVANQCTHVHDPRRSKRISPFDNHIPYEWDVKHG